MYVRAKLTFVSYFFLFFFVHLPLSHLSKFPTSLKYHRYLSDLSHVATLSWFLDFKTSFKLERNMWRRKGVVDPVHFRLMPNKIRPLRFWNFLKYFSHCIFVGTKWALFNPISYGKGTSWTWQINENSMRKRNIYFCPFFRLNQQWSEGSARCWASLLHSRLHHTIFKVDLSFRLWQKNWIWYLAFWIFGKVRHTWPRGVPHTLNTLSGNYLWEGQFGKSSAQNELFGPRPVSYTPFDAPGPILAF